MGEANELTREILEYLFRRGVYAWRQNTSGIFDKSTGRYRPSGGKKGVSDVLGVLPPNGRMLAVEVKVGRDRIREEQEGFLENVRKMGGVGIVVHSMEEFTREVEGGILG